MATQSQALPLGTGSSREALFDDAIRLCTSLISRIALSYEADPAQRRELVQDIFLAVWLALPSFRNENSLKAFVASIAQKRSITHLTRRSREPRKVELPPDLPSAALLPDELAVQNQQKQHLVESIHKLPVPQREAIVLCFEGFSYTEMAQMLGISTNAVMLRCQRAKSALKTIMERES
jgi:RNA polymerase sigma-70 factor (ECF subfamily)